MAICAFWNSAGYSVCQAPDHARPPVAVRTGLINPQGAVFNPAMGKAYIVDTEAGSVTISDDSANLIHHVSVGADPVSIAVDQADGRAYVANAGDGTVSAMDGKTDRVIASIRVGAHPYSIATDSAAGKVYVSRTFSDDVTVIDAKTLAVTSLHTGSSDLITVDPEQRITYLLGYEGGSLVILDSRTTSLEKRTMGMHTWGMALNEKTGALYIAKIGDAGVLLLAGPTATPRMIATGPIPCSVGINARTNTVYVVNYGDNSVTVIDGAKGSATLSIPVGKRPQSVTVDAEHNLVYIANTLGNSVTVIDGDSNKAIATLAAGIAPYALAIDPGAGRLHIANLDKHSFTILDVTRFQAQRPMR
jgi:YVTN family beta-propeller protein